MKRDDCVVYEGELKDLDLQKWMSVQLAPSCLRLLKKEIGKDFFEICSAYINRVKKIIQRAL